MTADQWWKGLSPTAFDKYVDKLSSEQYRSICATDPEFFEAVNTAPDMRKTWGKDANYTIKKDSALGQFVAEEEHERTRPERELNEQIAVMVEKDLAAKNKKLRSRLDAGLGLDAQLCTWLDLPKNIPVMPIPTAGFSGAGMEAVKSAAKSFMSKHENEGRFNEDEQLMLFKTMVDACGIVGKQFDPRSEISWETVYKICLFAGRVRPQRMQPAPKPEPVQQTLSKGLTESARRKKFTQEIVFHSRKLNRDLTMADIEGLLGDDYKTIIAEGYSADGELLTNTDQLRPGRAR